MKILEVVGLTCHVGTTAVLDALSFTLEEGEILALCGPAGAGKTALVQEITHRLLRDPHRPGSAAGAPADQHRVLHLLSLAATGFNKLSRALS